MSDSLITIVAIFLAAILMFVFPLAAISEMNDQETLALVQSYTTDFVNEIRREGKITQENYDAYIQRLYATGNSYDIEFEILKFLLYIESKGNNKCHTYCIRKRLSARCKRC